MFLSVGKWEKRKGFEQLMQAFGAEFLNDSRFALVLRTASGARDYLRTHPTLASATNIHIVSHVDGAGVAQLYKAADAFVLSTHAEGWGRPAMEAMSMVCEGATSPTNRWAGHGSAGSNARHLPTRGFLAVCT